MSEENRHPDPSASRLGVWAMAIRPRTLPTAVAPVVVGSAAAAAVGQFHLLPALAALAGALLLQIGVNLANDYFDFVKGVDTAERVGPVRVTQSGLIPPSQVRTAMAASLAMAGVIGLYLIRIGGIPILTIGVAAIIAALCYSGGPFPLASRALGDLFVFIFYGPVAVCGTYYVQAFSVSPLVILLSVQMGCLITAVLVVNNLRDLQTDKRAGKITMAVALGPKRSVVEYRLLITVAYLLAFAAWIAGWVSPWGLLPVAAFPKALQLFTEVRPETSPARMNQALASTAVHALIFAALAGAGVLLT
jgi:1,4-dihydroxy-2-naphthoate octaprenyltransferase